MAKKVYEETYIANIAKKIRDKTGGDSTYKTSEMPGGIDEVYEAGKETITKEITSINSELEQTLYGLDAGGKSFYDEFWDVFQENGNRRNYWGAFCYWQDEIFNPKYPIIASANKSMFYLSTMKNIPTIDISLSAKLEHTFDYSKVETIEKVIFKNDGSQGFQDGFKNCNLLKEVRFEGVIGQSGLKMADCILLSKASIESIINCLSTTTTGLSITLSKTAVDNAFTADEWSALISTRSNWTISLI